MGGRGLLYYNLFPDDADYTEFLNVVKARSFQEPDVNVTAAANEKKSSKKFRLIKRRFQGIIILRSYTFWGMAFTFPVNVQKEVYD